MTEIETKTPAASPMVSEQTAAPAAPLPLNASPSEASAKASGSPDETSRGEPQTRPSSHGVVASPKPYKILYVITKSNFGGAQRYVYDLATHAPPDAEVVVICGNATGMQEGLLVHKLTEAGVRTILIPELARDIGMTDFLAVYRIWQTIRREKPTVLHLNSSKAGALGALVGRLAGLFGRGVPKIIFTAHGWPFNEHRSYLWRVLVWLASVATIVLSHKVICVSTYDRSQFRGWFFANKIVGIRNALPPETYAEKDDARLNLVPHSNLYKDDIWVGYIGELNQNKNVSLALHAVGKARDAGCNIFFAIVGDGEDRLPLEDEAYDLKIDRNVKFLGFISDAPKLMKAFDIFLLTSRKEGMPYVLLEAQRAGIPIIASNVGGIPEIIHDGDNGLLFPSGSVEQCTTALIQLCKDQELRVQLSKIIPPEHFETMLRETFAQYLPDR